MESVTKPVEPIESPVDPQNAANGNGNASAASFEALLDQHEPEHMRRGQLVKGEIISLADNLAVVDVGAKRDAIVPPDEMSRLAGSELEGLAPGDQVTAYVLRTPVGDEELLVSLEKGLQEMDWQRASDYLDSEELIELNVVGYNKGGLLVDFGRLQGFIPNSHVPGLRNVRQRDKLDDRKSDLIGETLPVTVMEIDRQKRRLIMSARAAEQALREKQFEELEAGQVVSGRVEHLTDYGAFINLGSVTGLLHVSEMDWQHIDHPSDVLSPGQSLDVKVLSVDEDRERISLSRKELLPNPWFQFAQKYKSGDLVEVEITAIVDFGMFALVEFGIEGLIHISEIPTWVSGDLSESFELGQRMPAEVVSVEPDQERLGLSLKAVSADDQVQWMLQQQAAEEQPQDEEQVQDEADQIAGDQIAGGQIAEDAQMLAEDQPSVEEEASPPSDIQAEAQDQPATAGEEQEPVVAAESDAS